MPDNQNPAREPDQVIVIEKNGTKFTIREFFDGKDELADIIAKRVLRDLNPPFPNAKNR